MPLSGTKERKQWSTLFGQLVYLDLRTRYFNSRLGLAILIAQPLALLVVYSWIFGDLMQLKHQGGQDGHYFSEYLLAGLIAFNTLAEVFTRAPNLLLERRELLLNTALPAVLVPWVLVASSLLLEGISIALLIIWMSIQGLNPLWALGCYLPWLVIRLLWSSAGAALLSVLGVVLTDLRQVLSAILGILLLITPIFYRLEQIPSHWQTALLWNPFTYLIQGYQTALVQGEFKVLAWLPVLLASLVVWYLSVSMARRLLPKIRYVL